jgi:SAM-dependent methyltransferase
MADYQIMEFAVAEFSYSGQELELFAAAKNWKSYWASEVGPYLGTRILDVGAGIGSTARTLSSHKFERWVALEPDARLAGQMKEAAAVGAFGESFEVRVGSVPDLQPEERFDTILYIDVLEHIQDHQRELAHAAAHLEPDGRIVVLSPAHEWLYTPFDQAIGHVRRYNRRTLLAAIPNRLTVERADYLDSVGLLASLGNRLILRSSSPNAKQIRLWDEWMVPFSRILDRIALHSIGKSILGVFRLAV